MTAPSVFLAFVVAVTATGEPRGASRIVADEATCRQTVTVTVEQAQAAGRQVIAAGCHEVELQVGEAL